MSAGCLSEDFAVIALDDTCNIWLLEQALPSHVATTALEQLQQSTPWEQPSIRLYGKRHPVPRLQAWYGESHTRYVYSGLVMEPLPWTPLLDNLRGQVQRLTAHSYNSVLLNLYRHGRDCMGWHADDEPELGENPWIASLSLGVSRDFSFRRKGETRTRWKIPLVHNSLLLMSPAIQQHWQHSLPRRAGSGARINLTFRQVLP